MDLGLQFSGALGVDVQPVTSEVLAAINSREHHLLQSRRYDWLHISDVPLTVLTNARFDHHKFCTEGAFALCGHLVSRLRTFDFGFGIQQIRRCQVACNSSHRLDVKLINDYGSSR